MRSGVRISPGAPINQRHKKIGLGPWVAPQSHRSAPSLCVADDAQTEFRSGLHANDFRICSRDPRRKHRAPGQKLALRAVRCAGMTEFEAVTRHEGGMPGSPANARSVLWRTLGDVARYRRPAAPARAVVQSCPRQTCQPAGHPGRLSSATETTGPTSTRQGRDCSTSGAMRATTATTTPRSVS